MRILSVSVLLAGALLASEYSYEVSPMIGGVKAEGNLNIDEQFSYGLRFQMNDYDLLGLVPELSFDRTTDTDYESSNADTAINRFAFNGLYDFKDFSDSLTPYLLIGIGYEDVEDEKNGYDSSMYGNWGGGVKWKIVDDIALRAEVKHLIRTDDGGNELYYGIGLSIPFGEKVSNEPAKEEPKKEVAESIVVLDSDNDGITDSRDRCPNTPAGVKVDSDGCALDSDNDGVADYKDRCPKTLEGRVVDENGCEKDGDKDGVVDALDKCPTTVPGAAVDKNGCAESVILDIRFENDSSKINEGYSPKLEEYTQFLKNNPAYNVLIVGHTDSKGSNVHNQKLSEQRAASVKASLVKGGIDTARISTLGKGEDEAIADNKTAEGRAKNRRIEARLKLKD